LAIGSALSSFGNVLFLSGNLVEAETKLLEAVDFFESIRAGLSNDTYKVSIFETQTNTYSRLQEVLIAQNKTTQALEIAERGRARALVELLTSRLSQNNTNLSFTHPPSLQKIQQIAKEQKATIVEYSIIQQIIDAQLFIWVIHPTGEVEFRQVKLRGEQSISLEELVAETLEFMGVRIRGNQPDSVETISPSIEPNYRLQKLHQLLIEPIADLLPTHPNDRVIFIPHRELFAVPFPALQDSNGKYLIEKHTILTAPSIQVLELTRQQRQRIPSQAKSSLVVGNPTMPKVQPSDGGEPYQLASLEGSEREAQAIASLLNTKPLIGDQATKATILQQLPQARIVHLATHGLLDDIKGLESAIALAPSGGDNGLLTAEEIFDLKLNAELVVLSACNTGQGRITGDGVIGLSRSLISAGVPSVIVSLWFVPDTPTASLMTNFYRHLQQNPDKAQALRQAMLTTMKQHPNPKDWAAFTLIGEAEGSIPLGKKHYLK
jgi:CHAT domain-containing protein